MSQDDKARNIGEQIAVLGREAAATIARTLTSAGAPAGDIIKGTVLGTLYGSAVACRVAGITRESFLSQAAQVWDIAQLVKLNADFGVTSKGGDA